MRSFLAGSFLFALLAVLGCSEESKQTPTTQSADAKVDAAPNPCAKKACGVDCTPAGSDEPFNCNAAGACVAAGQPLDCKNAENACAGKACGVDCTPAGSDEPFNCNAAGQCVATGQPLGC